MLGAIVWIVGVVLGVIGLTIALIINARALKRDLNEHRQRFSTSLENAANAIVDNILQTNGAGRTPKQESAPPATHR